MNQGKRIDLTDAQRAELERRVRSQTLDARSVRRAKIVLLAADGVGNHEIARRLEISRGQVIAWRGRFADGGIKAIASDLPRSGRKPRIDAAEIVRVTTQTTPEGATHWSTRKLAAKLGVSDTTVFKVWRTHGLKPHLVETFKVSRDPKFVEKLEDYLYELQVFANKVLITRTNLNCHSCKWSLGCSGHEDFALSSWRRLIRPDVRTIQPEQSGLRLMGLNIYFLWSYQYGIH